MAAEAEAAEAPEAAEAAEDNMDRMKGTVFAVPFKFACYVRVICVLCTVLWHAMYVLCERGVYRSEKWMWDPASCLKWMISATK